MKRCTKLGNPGIWANEMEAKRCADWVDYPNAGLFSRKLYVVEDALGAKGRIGGVLYAFAAVLQVGQNVVIYQLNNLPRPGNLWVASDTPSPRAYRGWRDLNRRRRDAMKHRAVQKE